MNADVLNAALELKRMDDQTLVAQGLVQQGAINALSYLLANGCDETTAQRMLQSLRASADLVRQESVRRGKVGVISMEHIQVH